MKKYFLLLFCMLNACTPTEEILNKEYVGKEVYVCHKSYDLSPGKKIIQKVTVHNSNNNNDDERNEYGYYTINFVDNDGYYESMSFHNIKQQLMSQPFCTAQGYANYQRKAQDLKEKEQKVKVAIAEQNNDCVQAIEQAYKARQKLAKDIKVFNFSETVNLNKHIVVNDIEYQVIDTVTNGVIVSNNCEMIQNAGDALTNTWAMEGMLSAAGHFVKTLCQEDKIFIYTPQTNYATKERFTGNNLIYIRNGTYYYNGQSIKAYRVGSSVTPIEYKTYLKNKQLKCCQENEKTKVCN